MRVLLAGASGALGLSLTPALVQAGHEVYGTTRSGNTASICRSGRDATEHGRPRPRLGHGGRRGGQA